MKGTYAPLIQLPRDVSIKVGKLGEVKFEGGSYAYVGSALKNLDKRVERHLREEKNLHWHIDYLLTEAHVEEVLYGESGERKECVIAETLADIFPSIEGFGSSDCQCDSHLFHSKNISKLKEEVTSSFKKAGFQPKRW